MIIRISPLVIDDALDKYGLQTHAIVWGVDADDNDIVKLCYLCETEEEAERMSDEIFTKHPTWRIITSYRDTEESTSIQ